MYLLDTNAISELKKVSANSKANLGFKNWTYNVDTNLFFISQITVLELRKGALLKSRKDKLQGLMLQQWLNKMLLVMSDKILPVTNEICWKCAELHIPNPRSEFDSLIASTALVHDLILVTRNVQDFKDIENLRIFNPFTNGSNL